MPQPSLPWLNIIKVWIRFFVADLVDIFVVGRFLKECGFFDSMKPKKLKEALAEDLTEEELKHLVRAFDILGDMAILIVPDELVAKEKIIAEKILELHNNIKVVAKRDGNYQGEFRTIPLKVLAGEDRKETLYKENNSFLFLNPEVCYFSARSANERKRIAGLVKKGEDVLVMFSGVGPFPIVIARNSEVGSVVGIEKNPASHEYAERNVKKNKLQNVEVVCGDVHEVVPELGKKFDRVCMPLPKSAEDFLDTAFLAIKPKGWIHFYDFQHEDDYGVAKQKIADAAERAGRKVISMEVVECGNYAPRTHRISVDAQIE